MANMENFYDDFIITKLYLLAQKTLYECGCLDPVSTTDLVLSSRGFQVAQKVVGAEKKVRAMTDGHPSTSWTSSPATSSLNIASVIWSYVNTYVASGR